MPAWKAVVAAGVAIEAALIAVHGFNELTFESGVLALDSESGAAAWFSAIQFAAGGLLAITIGLVDTRARVFWIATGVLFLGFSFDDVVQVHEATEEAADSRFSRLGLQPLVTLVTLALIFATRARVPVPARGLLAAAATALVVALGASIVNAFNDFPKVLELTVFGIEEWAELLMATLLIAAVVARAPQVLRVSRVGAEPGQRSR